MRAVFFLTLEENVEWSICHKLYHPQPIGVLLAETQGFLMDMNTKRERVIAHLTHRQHGHILDLWAITIA
jgi:hypothetical protein